MKAIVTMSLTCTALASMLAVSAVGAHPIVNQVAAISAIGQAQPDVDAASSGSSGKERIEAPSRRFTPSLSGADRVQNRPASRAPAAGSTFRGGEFPAQVLQPPTGVPGEFRPGVIDGNALDRLPPTVGRTAPGGAPPTSPFSRALPNDPASFSPSGAMSGSPGGPSPISHPAKGKAAELVLNAHRALLRGDLDGAESLARQADQLKVPDAAFAPHEIRPWQVLQRIQWQRQGVVPARATAPAAGLPQGGAFPVSQGVYNPQADPTGNMQVQGLDGTVENRPPVQVAESRGQELFRQGLDALQAQDREGALRLFREAWNFQGELDPTTRQRLKDKLSLLANAAGPASSGREPSPLEQVDSAQNILRQKMYREIANEEKAAEQMLPNDAFGALEKMEKLREGVVAADLDPAARKQLLTLVDRKLVAFRNYIEQHRGEIEQDERNREILARIDRERAEKFEMENKIAELVEEYNDLIEEQRFAEAEIRAKQVRELSPDSPIARTLLINSRLGSRVREQMEIRELSEQGFYGAMTAVDASGIPFDDRVPIDFGDTENWAALSKTRRQRLEANRRRLSPTEMKIQEALKQKVHVQFTNRPLKEILDTLASMTDVNIYPDPEGLGAEGVTTDTPVTINLTQPISLRSALNLILEPLRLSYVIQNEVLRITSEQSRDSNVYTDVYNVADLVIPIPNFVPGYNVGLPAAIREAHRALGYGGTVQPVSTAPLTFASNDLQGNSSINSSVLAQSNAYGMLSGNAGTRPSQPLGAGMESAGGAALADFDTLIELITSTIAPDTWDEVGGPGAIEPFPTNLSLVISQTQDVHDQIADLLAQLRRLQDLQVTIEVRFITLRDDFFERLGVDFDFDIDDNVTSLPRDDSGNSVTIGLDAAGLPTADLDISVNQGSFGSTTPAFGGFDAASAANIGFAILSDIEAFFLLQAAQGDERTNVLQAPKVTLFNGQQASVSDTSQRPFVTSLVPVVGDFAAAHQPVIVVLSEGTSLSVQAVVSSDRRFVRLTLVPVFSQIGDVEEFTFSGRTTTNQSGSNVVDPDGNSTETSEENLTTTEGTTVQLPTFAFTSVSTTVSVPDGGTVLLGGIKRLREGRNEQGVPMLSKIPYVNRLFKNVAIGREAQSLMLMVTPRIIIQEEEEEKLGIEIPQ